MGVRRCCVFGCDNDSRYPNKIIKRSVVQSLKWHRFPADEAKKKIWEKYIQTGRGDFDPGNETFVCSNHFPDGKPTKANPHLTIYLTVRNCIVQQQPSPKKRRVLERSSSTITKPPSEDDQREIAVLLVIEETVSGPALPENETLTEVSVAPSTPVESNENVRTAMNFCQITREYDVRFYTGFTSTEIFNVIFNHLSKKASLMDYWQGPKRTTARLKKADKIDEGINTLLECPEYPEVLLIKIKKGPNRKLPRTGIFNGNDETATWSVD